MTRREKTLSIGVLSVAGALLLYVVANRMVLGRIRTLDAREKDLRQKIAQREFELSGLAAYKKRYADLRDRTYAEDPAEARGRARLRLSRIALLAGLSENRVQLSPTSTAGTRTKFGEAAVTVTGKGSLERLTNLLFLLDRDTYLHRVTTLDVKPEPNGREFSFSLRYATPVFDWKPPVDVAKRQALPEKATEPPALSDAGRTPFDVISRRNIFQPYVPPPPVYTRRRRDYDQPRQPYNPPPQPERQEDPLDRMIVSALPSTGRTPEVHVQIPGIPEAKVYKVGEKLPIGEIAMVDYRPMPMPNDPDVISHSRVIVRMGKDYRAVELSQPLGKWRALRPADLPDQLKPTPAPGKARALAPKSKPDESKGEPARQTDGPEDQG